MPKVETDASRNMDRNATTVGLVCRDNKGRIVHSIGKKFGDIHILVDEGTVIREALSVAGDCEMDNILIESDL